MVLRINSVAPYPKHRNQCFDLVYCNKRSFHIFDGIIKLRKRAACFHLRSHARYLSCHHKQIDSPLFSCLAIGSSSRPPAAEISSSSSRDRRRRSRVPDGCSCCISPSTVIDRTDEDTTTTSGQRLTEDVSRSRRKSHSQLLLLLLRWSPMAAVGSGWLSTPSGCDAFGELLAGRDIHSIFNANLASSLFRRSRRRRCRRRSLNRCRHKSVPACLHESTVSSLPRPPDHRYRRRRPLFGRCLPSPW